MAASTQGDQGVATLRAAFIALVVVAVVTNVAVLAGAAASLDSAVAGDTVRHLVVLAVLDGAFGAAVVAVGAALARRAVALTDQRQARRLRALVDGGPDLLAVVDQDGRFTYAAGVLAGAGGRGRMSGETLPGIVVREDTDRVVATLRELSSAEPGHRVEVSFAMPDGDRGVRHVRGYATNHCHDPAVDGLVVSVHDVTDQRTLEQELARQAFQDSLTGLANRALFRDRVDAAIARLVRARRAPTLLFIDLDDFKTVNDTYGHAVGDALLVSVAEDLLEVLREGDTAARLGGDEFAILLEDNAGEDVAMLVARRLRERLDRPRPIMGRTLTASGSIGIAPGRLGDSTEMLLRNADIAMYEAKRGRRDGVVVFEPTMHEELLRRTRLREGADPGVAEVRDDVDETVDLDAPDIADGLAAADRTATARDASG